MKSSRFLKAVSLFYLSFPIAFLVYSAVLFDIPVNEFGFIFFSGFFYVLSTLAVLTGYGLWTVKRWSWYFFVGVNVMMVYYTASVLSRLGQSHNPVLAYFLSLFILVGVTYLVTRELKVPYFLPRIRWWESNTRYQISVPVELKREDQSTLKGEIMDLSMGGCFIKLPEDLKQSERIALKIDVFGQLIHCEGDIVWVTQSTVTHPKGIGVKFVELNRSEKRRLRVAGKRIDRIMSLNRKSPRIMDRDEFMQNLEDLQYSLGHDKDKNDSKVL